MTIDFYKGLMKEKMEKSLIESSIFYPLVLKKAQAFVCQQKLSRLPKLINHKDELIRKLVIERLARGL